MKIDDLSTEELEMIADGLEDVRARPEIRASVANSKEVDALISKVEDALEASRRDDADSIRDSATDLKGDE